MSLDRIQLPQSLLLRTEKKNKQPIREEAEFVLYWARTALRCEENPALDAAITAANALGKPLLVYQGLSERYPYANDRHHAFILEGARDFAQGLTERGIANAFHLERPGHRQPVLKELVARSTVVLSEDMPVEPLRSWTQGLAEQSPVALVVVDTACIVPSNTVGRAFLRAFQYRKAIDSKLRSLDEPPVAVKLHQTNELPSLPFQPIDWDSQSIDELVSACAIDHSIAKAPDTRGGSRAGYARWEAFLEHNLVRYAADRNNPLLDGVSRMSPYLHYGMVAPMRLAREVASQKHPGAEKYLDELLVWRELAYTFCRYRSDHESLKAIPEWARQTLLDHASDERDMLYDEETLARGRTKNTLWNAAQQSLLHFGELHNNVRMTWGKAFVDWSETPTIALQRAIALNHRYALDGRDPASYGGILWCFGQFDRPFSPEEPVRGTIRPRPLQQHQARLNSNRYLEKLGKRMHPFAQRIAVIGAGPAGAICARTLADHGHVVTLFDKGRGPGGRLSTRRVDDPCLRFDHGAQYFSTRNRHLAWRVQAWEEAGHIARWPGHFMNYSNGRLTADPSPHPRFVGTPGMNGLVKHLLQGLDVRFGHRAQAIEQGSEGFTISFADHPPEQVDQVVVAIPAAQAIDLLVCRPAFQSLLQQVTVAPCWAVLCAPKAPIQADWSAIRCQHGAIGWIARNQTKPERPPGEQWVIHASPDWSRAKLEHDKEDCLQELIAETEQLVGQKLHCGYQTAHRWRYALVEEAVGQPCLYEGGIGVCGDALLGGRVESALVSGIALAGRALATVA